MEHTLKIVDGRVRFVYDDALVSLLDMGTATVTRVSHVEPHPTKGGWVADMTPAAEKPELAQAIGANGTWLVTIPGVWDLIQPFQTRAEALAAERQWLAKEKGL